MAVKQRETSLSTFFDKIYLLYIIDIYVRADTFDFSIRHSTTQLYRILWLNSFEAAEIFSEGQCPSDILYISQSLFKKFLLHLIYAVLISFKFIKYSLFIYIYGIDIK